MNIVNFIALTGQILVFLIILFKLLSFFNKKYRKDLERTSSGKYIGLLIKKGYSLKVLIILCSAGMLVAELAVIRALTSYFQLFSYIKNIHLIAAFLGIGIGFALSGRRYIYIIPAVLGIIFEIALLNVFRTTYYSFQLQNPLNNDVLFGIYTIQNFIHTGFVMIFILLVFFINVCMFIPLGQINGYLMNKVGGLVSYGYNLIGSIVGIGAFFILSWLLTPPIVWMIVLLLFFSILIINDRFNLTMVFVVFIICSALFVYDPDSTKKDIFSPYQMVTLYSGKNDQSKHFPLISSNNTFFQRVIDVTKQNKLISEDINAEYYHLPYKLLPSERKKVLIVGSGAGNDIASALYHGAETVDAVEIDPVIIDLGRKIHPNDPYSDKRVDIYVDDARAFFNRSNKRYDFLIYGLLDSHALNTGRSGVVRLDSYVYTIEGLAKASELLADNGVAIITFMGYYKDLNLKLFNMLSQAYDGIDPRVISVDYDQGLTFIISKDRELLATLIVPPGFHEVTDQYKNDTTYVPLSTDDWPFFYMVSKKISSSLLILLIGIIFISLYIVKIFKIGGYMIHSLKYMFLGMGFMLIETTSITKISRYFGTTWISTGITILLIIILSYLANLYIVKNKIVHRSATLIILIITAIIGSIIYNKDLYLFGGNLVGNILVGAIFLIPVFFSGIFFSTEIRNEKYLTHALSLNIIGSAIGGVLEYSSILYGIGFVNVIVIIVYLIAYILSVKKV